MDTKENRMSGGPIAYIADQTNSLPSLKLATVVWSNNEIQAITPAGTWTSGTYTLEVTYPDGSSETTAGIAFNADAATIKAALAALTHLDAADLTVTGGPLSATGPVVPVVVTFGGSYANTPMTLLAISVAAIVGGGTATVARTIAGRLWTELPDLIKDVSVKHVHKSTPHKPAFAPHPTGSTTTAIGIDSIAFVIEESDLSAFNTALARSLLVTTPPGAAQVGMETLTQPLPADVDSAVFRCALNYKGPKGSEGWGIIEHYFCIKRNHAFDFKAGEDVRQIGIGFDVFADPTEDFRCFEAFEYKLPVTP